MTYVISIWQKIHQFMSIYLKVIKWSCKMLALSYALVIFYDFILEFNLEIGEKINWIKCSDIQTLISLSLELKIKWERCKENKNWNLKYNLDLVNLTNFIAIIWHISWQKGTGSGWKLTPWLKWLCSQGIINLWLQRFISIPGPWQYLFEKWLIIYFLE